jgi:predicted RNA-binding protein associated with RNAse of E/G family
VTSVEIHYLRLPDRRTVFRQLLVHQTSDCIVTLMPVTKLARPVLAGDAIVLEPDAPAVWFTFPGVWHDIGRFHTVAGRFTGYYANLLTPVRFRGPNVWETTDLFLDVWLGVDGTIVVLDEDELDAALRDGTLDGDTALAARAETARIIAAATRGEWPPEVARSWTLERARAALRVSGGGSLTP